MSFKKKILYTVLFPMFIIGAVAATIVLGLQAGYVMTTKSWLETANMK